MRSKSEIIFERDKYTCFYCGYKTLYGLNIDHKIPRSQKGTDAFVNLVTTCRMCNGMKSSLPEETFKKIVRLAKVLARRRLENPDRQPL